MHRTEEGHSRSWSQRRAKLHIVNDCARQVGAPPRSNSDISSRPGLDHALGYAYHGTAGRCSWGSMGMLDRRMNQNVRTCTSCQISRGRRPQDARDGLGWVWRRPRQLSEADGSLEVGTVTDDGTNVSGQPKHAFAWRPWRLNLGAVDKSIDRAHIAYHHAVLRSGLCRVVGRMDAGSEMMDLIWQ